MTGAIVPRHSVIRETLKRITPLRSLYHFFLTVVDHARVRPTQVAREYDAIYRGQSDPWGYAGGGQQERYKIALQIIDRALDGKREPRILEIGCGEGLFTEMLVTRGARIVAADSSPVALDRARMLLGAHSNIEFRVFDVLTERIDERFDLIVIDHVIDLFARRAIYRKVAEQATLMLTSNGTVLIGAMRAFDLTENARWSLFLLAGGVAILDWIGRNTSLTPVETLTRSFYTYTLYRRRG